MITLSLAFFVLVPHLSQLLVAVTLLHKLFKGSTHRVSLTFTTYLMMRSSMSMPSLAIAYSVNSSITKPSTLTRCAFFLILLLLPR